VLLDDTDKETENLQTSFPFGSIKAAGLFGTIVGFPPMRRLHARVMEDASGNQIVPGIFR